MSVTASGVGSLWRDLSGHKAKHGSFWFDRAPGARSVSSLMRRLSVAVLAGVASLTLSLQETRAQTVAGVTPGALSVEESGAASYTIPIAVPPGTAGMEPSLSLIYNSQGGNGLLGVGWSLGGLSVIHRCPATIVQDTFIDGVDYDTNDKFCIDGQRLVAISGAYGADGTEYRTEIDGFAKIISNGAAGAGPASFTVWAKSGQIMEYGNTADSRIEGQGIADVRLWAVNRILDTVGNYLTVTYFEDNPNGEYRPTRIDYTSNDGTGLVANNSVEFVSSQRNDHIKLYSAGGEILTTQLITNIKTYAGQDLVRDYRLVYDYGGAASRLRLLSVTECDGAGVCLSPTQFGWLTSTTGVINHPSLNNFSPGQAFTNNSVYPILAGDWNGDGVTDVARVGVSGISFFRATPSTWGYVTSFFDWAPTQGYSDGNIFPVITGDWNGDGMTDVGRVGGNEVRFKISTGVGWSTYPNIGNWSPGQTFTDANTYPIFTGDWNGDGRTDVARVSGVNIGFQVSTGSGWTDYPGFTDWSPDQGYTDADKFPILVGDWNGDGMTDIGRVGGNEVRFLISTGWGWNSYPNFGDWSPGQGYGSNHTHPVLTGDWNGDGITDIARVGGNEIRFRVSSGAGWHFYPNLGNFSPGQGYQDTSVHPILTGDWNGDGRTDVARVGNVNLTFKISKPDGTWPNSAVLNNWSLDQTYTDSNKFPLLTGDWNGDGMTDAARVSGVNTGFVVSTSKPDLLTQVTDSLGATTTITYTPITDNYIYTHAMGAAYPEMNLMVPLYVVSQVAKDDGLTGQALTDYAYGGARAHLEGRGFLGFAWMEVTDQQTGIVTRTDYRQDHPYIGQVAASRTYMPDPGGEILITRLTNTWDKRDLHGGLTAFPFVAQSTAEAFEFNHGPQTP